MIYFMQKHPHNSKEIEMRASEVSQDRALELYKYGSGGGFCILDSVQDFVKGITYNQGHYTIWGEDIDQKECFRRRLSGKLVGEVLK